MSTSKSKKGGEEEMAMEEALRDFTKRENWDKFFELRDGAHPFEWYADWPALRQPLLSLLSSFSSSPPEILVPGCGNSRLSEHLYDAGFRRLTNIDFSKVVVSDMLRLHVRSRPEMRWRVMDMTHLQFADGSFDAVIDKGGLDALMEPEHGPKLGTQYLSEVERVLRIGGIFVCLTLAESHVLDLLFSKFRFGWEISIDKIPHKPSEKPNFQTFMVVVAKESSKTVKRIAPSFDQSSVDCSGNQGHGLLQAIEVENKLRSKFSEDAEIASSISDLQLETKVSLKELIPGRRVQLVLGEKGESRFSYKATLLDSRLQSGQCTFHCGVFLVPKTRAHEWLFSSEEGQWVIVESSKAARLIMVYLDSVQMHASMDDIQKDLSPLIKSLAPEEFNNGAQIPFMIANDGVKQRNIVQKVASPMTGEIIVEDVIYENHDDDGSNSFPPKDSTFRRLTFERSLGLVQSEALLLKEDQGPQETDKKNISSKSRRGSQRRSSSRMPITDGSKYYLKFDHSFLASSYHGGIISGFTLISSCLEKAALSARKVRTVIIGLGAGLLPMFLHECMPISDVEVVELDPVVLDVARDHFGFTEEIKVHVTDGIQFIREVANSANLSDMTIKDEKDGDSLSKFNANDGGSIAERSKLAKIDILIVDADSSDASSGLTCPPADFAEECFLLSVKESLAENGLFVINLVSRSAAIREMVIARMKQVFSQLFCLELEEDVNKILFALPTEGCLAVDSSDAGIGLQKLLNSEHPEIGSNITEAAKKIRQL